MKIQQIAITKYIPTMFDIHVTPDSGFWSVKQVRARFAFGTFMSQLEAVGVGITQAREALSFLVIHARDGRVREVRNYTKSVVVPD